MDYNIYKDGTLVNTIYASESFISDYCAAHGYTYKERIPPDSVDGRLRTMAEQLDRMHETEALTLELAADHEARMCTLELGV